jgi:hypothetical protein
MEHLRVAEPVSNFSGAGASLSLPEGAPASTHALIVSISRLVSRRSFSKCP